MKIIFDTPFLSLQLMMCVLVASPVASRLLEGYQVVQTTPNTEEDVDFLGELMLSDTSFENDIDADEALPDFQFEEVGSQPGYPVEITVSPAKFEDLLTSLTQRGMEAIVTIADLQALIDGQVGSHLTGISTKNHLVSRDGEEKTQVSRDVPFALDQYHTLSEINDWMDDMTEAFPSMVSKFFVGNSTEARTIFGLKVSSPGSTSSKEAVLINGGIHAREWMSPAVVIYTVVQLTSMYGTDLAVQEIVDAYDWYLIPVSNPDGYVFTWTTDRTWRKTRSGPYKCRRYREFADGYEASCTCMGVDPNRNFDFRWGVIHSRYNAMPCFQVYIGPDAASEPEVQGLSNVMMDLASSNGLKMMLDMHTAGKSLRPPWGYSPLLPKDYDVQRAAAEVGRAAILAVHGLNVTIFRTYELVPLRGGIRDFAYGVANAVFSYTVEMGVDAYSHYIPPEFIIRQAEEYFAGIVAMTQFVMQV